MKILFMGTPDFALFSLKALVEGGEDVIGVVTQPDKPKGRGHRLLPPPVKVYACEQNIPVYQPNTLCGEEFAALLDNLAPDVIVVAAYGKILPKNVLDYPRFGCINVHGSLLPEYRGAAPIQRAIIDGKSETGITIMYMAEGLDTGDMILKKTAPIYENDNFKVVHDRLGLLGSEALMEALSMIKNGTAERVPQDDLLSNYATKIEKSDCLLDFSLDARTLHNKIRGLSPIPLAFTHTPDGKLLKIVASAVVENEETHENAGEIIELDETIRIMCGKGTLDILTLLPEGKGRMSAADFIRGRKVNVGDVLK